MNRGILLLFIIMASITACGPSKSDRLIQELNQKEHDDSVKRVAEDEMKHKIEMRFALNDSIKRDKIEISNLKKSIDNAKSEFEVQTDKLARIKEFKFLRASSEREREIRNQVDVINKVESLKDELANKLVNLQVKLDYFNSEVQKYTDNVR